MSQYEYRVIGFGGMVGKPKEKIFEFGIPESEAVKKLFKKEFECEVRMEPKFKFGEMVEGLGDRGEKVVFEITDIKKYPDGYSYSNSSIDGYFSESDLTIYERPKNKKLYAYKHSEEVKFFKSPNLTMLAERSPEYDIEYNEE